MPQIKAPSLDLLPSSGLSQESHHVRREVAGANVGAIALDGVILDINSAIPIMEHAASQTEKTTEQRSVERLNTLATVTKELEAKIPDLAGVTLFGSTVRGHAKETSDLDLNVFIEVPEDALTGDAPKVSATHTESGLSMHELNLSDKLERRIAVRNAIKEHNLPDSDIDILPINEAIVREEVTELLARAEENWKTGNIKGWSPRNIRALFNMPVGQNSSLEKYQQQVIQQLSNSELGKIGWYMVWNKVTYFEEGRVNRDEPGYRRMAMSEPPIKLADAREAFGVEMPNAKSDSLILGSPNPSR